jgi:uncharacterized membrane protein YqjE
MNNQDSRSIGEILHDIISNVQLMFRAEIRLAKVEAAKAAKAYGAAALFGLYAGGLILLALAFLLANWMPLWMATLLVGLVTGTVALILLSTGKRRLEKVHPKPEKTIRTVKENLEWARSQAK